ncbi:MAG: glycosyltransferase family 4 protein [Burkholderiaceae bacterium]
MKLLLITDAWAPQINGVAQTLARTQAELIRMGHQVQVVEPSQFLSLPVPMERGLRLAMVTSGMMERRIRGFAPQAIHIATEGPLGWAARKACLRLGLRFTSAWHTNFPAYLKSRFGLAEQWSWPRLTRFHQPSLAVMCPTAGVARQLQQQGMENVQVWGRGVDAELFSPGRSWRFAGLPRPVFLSVGRVASEKNLEAFLSLDLPGSQVVVGAGPALAGLRRRYPKAHFVGAVEHQDLPDVYRAADVFVFPSRTDTFGLVMLEAMACGVPVAALPAAAQREVVANGVSGVVDQNLHLACLAALELAPANARAHAQGYGWRHATERFVSLLAVPATTSASPASFPSSLASSSPSRLSAFSSSSNASAQTD